MLQNSLTVTHIMSFKKSCLVFSYTNVIDDINKVQKTFVIREIDRQMDRQTDKQTEGWIFG